MLGCEVWVASISAVLGDRVDVQEDHQEKNQRVQLSQESRWLDQVEHRQNH
jgi:hypothetical protein